MPYLDATNGKQRLFEQSHVVLFDTCQFNGPLGLVTCDRFNAPVSFSGFRREHVDHFGLGFEQRNAGLGLNHLLQRTVQGEQVGTVLEQPCDVLFCQQVFEEREASDLCTNNVISSLGLGRNAKVTSHVGLKTVNIRLKS